jgi:16S rRNA (cytosine967-C5)-methyltransferase
MSRAPQFRLAVELLQSVLNGTAPADKQMETFFRAHREMGMRDRGFVAESVYGVLRQRRICEAILSGAGREQATQGLAAFTATPAEPSGKAAVVTERVRAEGLLAAYLLLQGWSGRTLSEAGYKGDAAALAEQTRTLDRAALPLAVRANLPDWLAERLVALLGEDETAALAEALNHPAPVDLRVNTFKAKREDVQARLAAEGYATEATPYSPLGLRRHERGPLFKSHAFSEGLFEVQDEGSQLISLLVEAKRRESVVDFCAGAGGKTLHLGAAMANTGAVYAFDTAEWRLEKLKPRLKRSGLQNIRSVAIRDERDPRVTRLAAKIDRVLVDAPCSGTGTLRRNPDIKWRPVDLGELHAVQRRILDAAATLVKPGGRVVYATCSLLREENEDVVADFLASHPQFAQIPVAEIFARRGVPLTMEGPALRLYPHRHNTDGFFAAVLEQKAE